MKRRAFLSGLSAALAAAIPASAGMLLEPSESLYGALAANGVYTRAEVRDLEGLISDARASCDESCARPLEVSIWADVASLQAAFSALATAIGDSPERTQKAHDFCFGGRERLTDGLVDLRGASALGKESFILRLDVTDRFREFTRALGAGELDR